MTLREYLEIAPEKKTLYLGAKVAFLFGGTKDELLAELPKLNAYWNKADDFIPFEDREVREVFERTAENAINILVKGEEAGKMWSVKEGTEEWNRVEITYNEELLVQAIVKGVMDDYSLSFRKELEDLREMLKALERYRTSSESMEKYLRSEEFKRFTTLDPEYLIDKTRMLVSEAILEADERKVKKQAKERGEGDDNKV